MLTLTTANGNTYQISKFARSFYINDDETLTTSASVEISNSVILMDHFLAKFVKDDKTCMTIQKDGTTVVTLEGYEFSNSYQEIQDVNWGNDNYTLSFDKKTIDTDTVSE